jgi:hypothetical protein
MRHLAQVQREEHSESATLCLLAVQKAAHTWTVLSKPTEIQLTASSDRPNYHHNALVIVDLSDHYTVQHIEDALPWVLNVIENYLSTGLSPETLQEEVDRAEQWRQSLTLRSQELGRRALEMEARRDQIQELEKNLQQDKERIETIAAQLQSNQDDEQQSAIASSNEDS